MSDIFDELATRAPINATAGKVVSSGVHYEPSKIIDCVDQDMPIPIDWHKKKGPKLKNARFGKLTVVGWALDLNGRWVVKCDCGRYSVRTSRAIRNKNNKADCCEICRHLLYLKRTDYWKRTGEEKPLEYFL